MDLEKLMQEFTDGDAEKQLGALHHAFVEATRAAEDAEAAAKEARQRAEACGEALRDAMIDAGMQKMTGGGYTSFLRNEERYYVHAADREACFEWLREQGMADIIKTEPSVHSGTLNKTLREYIEEGGEAPDWMQQSEQTKAVLRRA